MELEQDILPDDTSRRRQKSKDLRSAGWWKQLSGRKRLLSETGGKR